MRKAKVANGELETKRRTLALYNNQFSRAVSTINSTIHNLTLLSENIDTTIGEIDEYQKNLEETKVELANTKQKNEQVIQNFKTLLAIE